MKLSDLNSGRGVRMIHLTINTGHSRVSSRGEVFAEAIEALRPLVIAGQGVVPHLPPYKITITREPGCAVYTISHPEYGPLITGALCYQRERRDYAWQVIERLYLDTTEVALKAGIPASDSIMEMPPCPASEPWLAVVIIGAAYLTADTFLQWVGDLERCLAWTIMETP